MSLEPSLNQGLFRTQITLPAASPAPEHRYLAWYQYIVLSIVLAIIYTNLPIYGFTQNASLPPKYLFFLMFLLMAPLLVARRTALVAYLLSPFALWAMALVVLNVIHLSAWSADPDVGKAYLVDTRAQLRAALILTRIQYIVFAILFGFVVFTTSSKVYLRTMVVLMVLLPCAVLLDFAQPGLFYPPDIEGVVAGRAAAMFVNPTMAGEVLLHVFVIGCAAIGMKYRGPLFLLTGAGVLTTFSRSSIIGWAFLLLLLSFRRTLPRSQVVIVVVAIVVFVLFSGNFDEYLRMHEQVEGASNNILSRLDFFSSYNFDDDSSEERAAVGKAGWEMFLSNPIFGAGAGATHFWSHRGGTHNQLLLFAAEYGVFGIGLWLWMLLILWRGKFFEDRGLQLAIVFLFAFMSMFTHLMIDAETYWLTTFALASVSVTRYDAVRARRQRRRRLQYLPVENSSGHVLGRLGTR